MDAAPVGPVGHAEILGNAIWLPVTNGNAADLEIVVSEASPPTGLKFDAVNVIAVPKLAIVPSTVIVSPMIAYAKFDLPACTDLYSL